MPACALTCSSMSKSADHGGIHLLRHGVLVHLQLLMVHKTFSVSCKRIQGMDNTSKQIIRLVVSVSCINTGLTVRYTDDEFQFVSHLLDLSRSCCPLITS